MTERIGFSTGALEKGDFRKAVDWVNQQQMNEVELSALRYDELRPLIQSLDGLPVQKFRYVSFHAPTSFAKEKESEVISLLQPVLRRGWNIIVHPDVIFTPALWRDFGQQLLVENMDRRKPVGRTVEEMRAILQNLPLARLCLDIAHARQMDTTLSLLHSFTQAFKERIGEVHISELDSRCRHLPLSWSAVADYRKFARALQNIPVIIESMLPNGDGAMRQEEIILARDALAPETN